MLTTMTFKHALDTKQTEISVQYMQKFCELNNIKLCFIQKKRTMLYTLIYKGNTLLKDVKLRDVCKYIFTVEHIDGYFRGSQANINLFRLYNFTAEQLGENEVQWCFDVTYDIHRFLRVFTLKESEQLARLIEDILPIDECDFCFHRIHGNLESRGGK